MHVPSALRSPFLVDNSTASSNTRFMNSSSPWWWWWWFYRRKGGKGTAVRGPFLGTRCTYNNLPLEARMQLFVEPNLHRLLGLEVAKDEVDGGNHRLLDFGGHFLYVRYMGWDGISGLGPWKRRGRGREEKRKPSVGFGGKSHLFSLSVVVGVHCTLFLCHT